MKRNKSIKISEKISLLLIIICFCLNGFSFYHKVEIIYLDGKGCCETIDEASNIEKRKIREDAQKKKAKHEQIMESSRPIFTCVGILCLLISIPLFIYGLRKKNNVLINFLLFVSMYFYLILIFDTY